MMGIKKGEHLSKEHKLALSRAKKGVPRNPSGILIPDSVSKAKYRRTHHVEISKKNAEYRQTQGYRDSRKRYTDSGKKRRADHNGHLKHAYGKTLADKETQYAKQKGICTLCGDPLPLDILKCSWDHDHVTGKMRDLIHQRCNLVLGFIECSLREKALAYLERHNGTN